MHARIRQSCFLIVFAFLGFGFLTIALAESTTVTSNGIKFPDGTTQTTAASGGDSLWSQSGDNIYYNNGKVSIGTSAPQSKLEVYSEESPTGSTTWPARFTRSYQSSGNKPYTTICLTNIAPNGMSDGYGSSVLFQVQDDGSGPNRMGLVGACRDGSDTSGALVFLTFTSGIQSEKMRISNVGNVGIGTTSPSYPLEMASGAHVTTGGVWTDASSREYKENIRDLSYDEATSALSSLKPSKFNYKVDKDDDYLGFIAEDVPDLVATKDRKSLSSMDIVAVLTKVVQQQQKSISALSKKMTELEKELRSKEAPILAKVQLKK